MNSTCFTVLAGALLVVPDLGVLFAADCSVSLSRNGGSYPGAATRDSFDVIDPEGCDWGAVSDVSWARVVGWPPGGSTDGTVYFTLDENYTGAHRTGTITVQDQLFTITQTPCVLSLSRNGGSYPGAATRDSFDVIDPEGCGWGVMSDVSWARVVGWPLGGSTDGTVYFTLDENYTGAHRTGTMTVQDQLFTITQTPCVLSLSRNGGSYPGAVTQDSFIVSDPGGCAWLPMTPEGWIRVFPREQQNGDGIVYFDLTGNYTGAERTGAVTIGDRLFTIIQEPCIYTLSPASADVPASGGGGTLSVAAQEGCSWTATSTSDWLTITSESHYGNADVPWSVGANTSGHIREARIEVVGAAFTVTQAPAKTCEEILEGAVVVHATADGKGMEATFTPNHNATIAEAALTCGLHHFNWIQWIIHDDCPATFNGKVPSFPQFDPPLGGWDYQQASGGDDDSIGYWNELDGELDRYTSQKQLFFEDYPAGCSGSQKTVFRLALLGVGRDGFKSIRSPIFTWESSSTGTKTVKKNTDPSIVTSGVVTLSTVCTPAQLTVDDHILLTDNSVDTSEWPCSLSVVGSRRNELSILVINAKPNVVHVVLASNDLATWTQMSGFTPASPVITNVVQIPESSPTMFIRLSRTQSNAGTHRPAGDGPTPLP